MAEHRLRSRFCVNKVPREMGTSIPDISRVGITRSENIERPVLNVHILRHDPLRLAKAGHVWVETDRQSSEVTLFCRAQKTQCRWDEDTVPIRPTRRRGC